MPGKRASEAQKREFFALLAGGLSIPMAAERVSMSRQWGYRVANGINPATSHAEADRRAEAQPDPKTWDELSTDARAALEDFNVFSEMFLLRRPMAWRRDAALRVVDALEDPGRSFIVLNLPPGAGKTTMVTHDLEAWLIAGGGRCDPARGRALRLMLGSFGMTTAKHYVSRLRRLLESPRPYYSKEDQRTAESSMVRQFGRFKPRAEGLPWTAEQFITEQIGDFDIYEKEPTVQAASRERGFLGERVDLASWDDLVVSSNTRSADMRETLAEWYADEAETRIEPGGVGLLVGQRLGPQDLYRDRLDVTYTDDETHEQRRKYVHIVYPAHHEDLCDAGTDGGFHRQWDGEKDGCLLDEERLPWKELSTRKQTDPRKFRMLYQQEDVDPAGALVDEAWIDGGRDRDGFEVPGCLDLDRGFHQWPESAGKTIDYATLDPSVGNWWALEWWAVQPETRFNYLIEGRRAKIPAGAFLDWDNGKQEFTGWMHEVTVKSYEMGHPIRVWIIEANAAHKYLLQFQHFRKWRQVFPGVQVIAHTTGANKINEGFGVEGLLPALYRDGLKRLPYAPADRDARRFVDAFRKELTTYPDGATDDMVMADWIGQWNQRAVLSAGKREHTPKESTVALPPYLKRQRAEASIGANDS